MTLNCTCRALGLSAITSAASLKARDAFCSPSAAITWTDNHNLHPRHPFGDLFWNSWSDKFGQFPALTQQQRHLLSKNFERNRCLETLHQSSFSKASDGSFFKCDFLLFKTSLKFFTFFWQSIKNWWHKGIRSDPRPRVHYEESSCDICLFRWSWKCVLCLLSLHRKSLHWPNKHSNSRPPHIFLNLKLSTTVIITKPQHHTTPPWPNFGIDPHISLHRHIWLYIIHPLKLGVTIY